ncbi:MAG: hypothetical protein EKK46_02705 [Rhodocyclaceae bacterium]|nr:MAG: hypothetical protein EKK46_02705 [Rhodocyclaceae bacterium]
MALPAATILSDFPLPALDGSEAPAFTNAATARNWAAALPLTNPAQVHNDLLKEIGLLNRWPLPAAERLAILDALRKAVSFAQDEIGKRYGGKALPLALGEQMAFTNGRTLRQACVAGNLRCAADAQDEKVLATAMQRALAHLASLQLEYLRGRSQVPREYWRQLHGLFALAESKGLAATPVSDPVRHGDNATSSLAAYGEALLLHAASPFELSPRNLAWMARWARRWGAKLTLAKAPPESLDALPLAVDLASDLPPRHLPFQGDGARFLLTHELRNSLKSRITLLGQGRSPADLQLGDDCTQPACEALLKQLYPRWCKGGQPRGTERRPENSPGRTIFGGEGIYYHLSGGHRLQAAAEASIADLRQQRENLALFGTLDRATVKAVDTGPVPPIETHWQLRDESATGLRLARLLDSKDAARLNLGQLIAVEPPGTKRFFLAAVRWLMADNEGWLQAGVQLLPGPVEAFAQRPADAPAGGGKEPWKQAFLLPALAARQEPESLVLPTGSFRAGRKLEIKDGEPIKLTKLLERGEDFERVAYE